MRLILCALVLVAAPLAAQNSQCVPLSSGDGSRQRCDAAIDFTRAYHPLAGLAVAGGNPVLGSGGATGKPGTFSVTLRANGFRLSVPDLTNVSSGGTVPEDTDVLAPAPVIEGNLGLFGGFASGLLALDLLLAAQLVPNEDIAEEIRVDPDAPRIGPVALGIGFGARIGVLEESDVVPGVAVSVMRRTVPRVGYGNVAAGDEVAADVDLRATTLRLTAGKQVGMLAVAAGFGWSRYTGDAVATYDAGVGTGTIALELDQTRAMYFLDAGLHVGLVRIVGEIGYQRGRDQRLGTTFAGYDDTSGTTFYSIGLRVGR